MSSQVRIRNVGACLATVFIAVLATFLGPRAFVEQTQLTCPGEPQHRVFPNMDACAADPHFRSEGCYCSKLKNEFHAWYTFGAIPLIVAIVAYLGTVGSLPRRLFWMFIAIAGAIGIEFAFALVENAAAALYALPGLPISLTVTFGIAAALFMLIHIGRKMVTKR